MDVWRVPKIRERCGPIPLGWGIVEPLKTCPSSVKVTRPTSTKLKYPETDDLFYNSHQIIDE